MGPLGLILMCFLLTAEAKPLVSIEDYFGSVYWPADIAKEITCKASDVVGNGRFVWKLDEEVIENQNQPINDGYDELIETLTLTPQIVDDDKELSCSFIYDDKVESNLDKIRIRVVYSDIKETTDARQLVVGESGELVVEFKVFPEPESNKIVWKVDKERIPLDGTGQDGRFKSSGLINTNGILYSVTLSIDKVIKEDGEKSISLEMETGHLMNRKQKEVAVKYSVIDQEPPAEEEDKQKSDSPMSSKLSTGVIVIIVLVILVILISIGYCFYKKYGRTTKPVEQQQAAYSAVATGETTQNPV